MICRPRSPYLASHSFRYGWVRWQLMQPNVQKSRHQERTQLRRSPSWPAESPRRATAECRRSREPDRSYAARRRAVSYSLKLIAGPRMSGLPGLEAATSCATFSSSPDVPATPASASWSRHVVLHDPLHGRRRSRRTRAAPRDEGQAARTRSRSPSPPALPPRTGRRTGSRRRSPLIRVIACCPSTATTSSGTRNLHGERRGEDDYLDGREGPAGRHDRDRRKHRSRARARTRAPAPPLISSAYRFLRCRTPPRRANGMLQYPSHGRHEQTHPHDHEGDDPEGGGQPAIAGSNWGPPATRPAG